MKNHFKKYWFVYLLLLASTVTFVYLEIVKARLLEEQAQSFKIEMEGLLDSANKKLAEQDEKHLLTLLPAITWAVKKELATGNQENVEQYFKQLENFDKIDEIALFDKDGSYLISADMPRKGENPPEAYQEFLKRADGIKVFSYEDKLIGLSPVKTTQNNFGVIAITYFKESISREESH